MSVAAAVSVEHQLQVNKAAPLMRGSTAAESRRVNGAQPLLVSVLT